MSAYRPGDPLLDRIPARGLGPPPPADDFAGALAAGRGRRRRRLGELAAAATVVAVAVAVVGSRELPSPAQELGVTSGVGGVSPAPLATGRPTRPAVSQPAPAYAATSGVAPGQSRVAPERPKTPANSPATPANRTGPRASRPAPPREHELVYLSYKDQNLDDPCEGDGTDGWCWDAEARDGAGGTRSLVLRACRSAGNVDGGLSFDHEYEADFAVRRGAGEVWRWSVGLPTTDDPHTIQVDRWQCALWTTAYDLADQAGRPLPAGEYTLVATSLAQSFGAPRAEVQTTFTVP